MPASFRPLRTAGRDVPIAGPEAWDSLMLDGREEVLVYFDESNRADYLSGRVDTERYGLQPVLACALCWCIGRRGEGRAGGTGDDPQRVNMGRRFCRPLRAKKALRMGRKRGGNAASFAWKAPFTCKGAFGQ